MLFVFAALKIKPRRRPVSRGTSDSGDPLFKYPITGIAGCCARAASGHDTAAPPSAASNSRRPTVTVMCPSRARCVKGTIPRLQRAVFTFEEAGCWLLPPQSPALTALLPPPALGERCHRILARRSVAVGRRAILVATGTLTDWTPRAGAGCPRSLAH